MGRLERAQRGRQARRRGGQLSALLVLVLSALVAGPALGAKADDQAKKLIRDAMEDDYLATNMTAAVAKLQNALKACENNACSKETMARIYGSLGTVYSAGLSAHEEAVSAFKKMLEADPKATPASAYVTAEVQKDFDRAKKESGTSGQGGKGATPPPVSPGPVAVLVEKPWAEQATFHPIPIYVEAPKGVEVTRVLARYRAPGQKEWKEITLNKVDDGWGGYVPCSATEKKGVLVYFVTAFDSNLDRVASAGSGDDPRKVQLKDSISGRQPVLPGAVPPEACQRPEQRMSCETNDDCPGAQACVNTMCVDEGSLDKPEPEDKTPRKQNWLSLVFSPDLTVVSGTNDACSAKAQQDGKLACFYSDKTQYEGVPVDGDGNSLRGGVALGSMRILAGYDRLVTKRVTVGLRLGFAFLGTPKRSGGKTFVPLHAEARGAYYFGADPFAGKGVRPYVFAGAGYAQVSARLSTEVLDQDPSLGIVSRTLDVYKTSGPYFGGAGLGVQYAVSPEAAMVVEVGARAMFPDFAPVIAPALGFAYGI